MSAPFEVQPYATRRAQLLSHIGEGIAIIPTTHEIIRNRDATYPFRHDSYFYYLTGFPEPEAVVVLIGKSHLAPARSVLFCRDKDETREIWDGYRYGPEAAKEVFGFDEAHSITKLDEELSRLVENKDTLYTPLFGNDTSSAAWNETITKAVNGVRMRARQGVWPPTSFIDVRKLLDKMRLQKDAHEMTLMRRAAEISSQAHIRAMQRCKPGMFEYQIEAEIMHEFIRFGAVNPAYGSIVASGPGACVLHYHENNRKMQDGDLLLIDAGCEYMSYAADITRTFPVNGKFTGEQKAVYEAVLEAQLKCMDALKPGQPFNAYHDVATRSLTQSMIDLGLLKNTTLEHALEQKLYEQFYMHRAGHWLGMDVHDAGAYRHQGVFTTLAPGMVLTNEPGLYIRPAKNVDERWWNIGVRIEDDVHITAAGNENLTAATPKTVVEIEAVMRGSKYA
jgi:Xaa-Pro aminopeptidase